MDKDFWLEHYKDYIQKVNAILIYIDKTDDVDLEYVKKEIKKIWSGKDEN